jgi:hypothetical protein
MVSFVGALVFVFSLLPALVFFSFAQLCHLRREFFFVFFGRLFPVTKGVVSYYFRSIRFFFSSDFLRRLSEFGNLHHLFIRKFCLCLNLGIFGPLSTNKGFVSHFDSLAFCQISYRCCWIRYLASSVNHKILCVFESRLCFGPLSTNKGLVLNFGPFALGEISYRCFWIWYFASSV